MDFSGLLLFGGILTYVGVVVYLANRIDAAHASAAIASAEGHARLDSGSMERWLRWLQYGLVGMIFLLGFGVLQAAFLGDVAGEAQTIGGPPLPEVSVVGGGVTFLLAIAVCLLSFQMIANAGLRQRIQGLVNQQGGVYKPESRVHNAAILLMLAVTVYVIVVLALEGGVSGIAESLQENGIEIGDVVFQAAVEILITFLGVGLAIRRDLPQTLARLGLRLPTQQDITWGLGLGVGFWLLMLVVDSIWVSLTSPELLQEQTAAAEQVSLAFATLPLAFLLSASAAIGEEIWIRGGLQPVFGIWITSVFFTILHIQVALTPAMLIIFGLSLALGWLRQRQSTVAAMIAHFSFNFIQLALLSLILQAAG